MEIRPREVTIPILEFLDDNHRRVELYRQGNWTYYRNFLYLDEDPEWYSDLELDVLARLTEALAVHRPPCERGGYDHGCNFIRVSKQLGLPGLHGWHSSRDRSNDHADSLTLAKLVSRFYLLDMLKPGVWVHDRDYEPHMLVSAAIGIPELAMSHHGEGQIMEAHRRELMLAAGSRDELDWLKTLHEVEMAENIRLTPALALENDHRVLPGY